MGGFFIFIWAIPSAASVAPARVGLSVTIPRFGARFARASPAGFPLLSLLQRRYKVQNCVLILIKIRKLTCRKLKDSKSPFLS